MTTAAEATIDESPPLEDNASAVLCTVPQPSALLPRLPIRAFFPITTDRTLDERLTTRRTVTVRGIYYSYTFLTSPTIDNKSNNTPLRTYSAPSRLERSLSMPSSPSPPQQARTTSSSPQPLSPVSDAQPSSSASTSQQGQPNIDKDTAHSEQVNSEQNPLQDNGEDCTDDQNAGQPQSENSELYLFQNISEDLADDKDSAEFQQDNNEPHLHQDNSERYTDHSSFIDTCPADTTSTEEAIDKVQPCLKERIDSPLVAEPTINLSTPPFRSTSSSRLPIRTSKSMPTQYSPNDSAVSAKTAALPVAGLLKTTVPPRRQAMQANLHTSNRSSSPKPSSVPIRKAMTSHRPGSKVPTISTARTARVREADVPMPRKAMNGPISAGTGQESKDTKEDRRDEDEEAAPVRLTAQEKRRREAMRAQQIKLWRVREEREAREARTVARRRLMERRREPSPSPPPPGPRRAVKFNLKRNKVIEISEQEAS